MPVSNQQLFTARQRSAVDDMARLRIKVAEMERLCPQHSDEVAIVLKALARVQKKICNIKQEDKKP